MAEPADFQRQQLAFAAHIRDPDAVAPPAGIEDRRMAIYRSLFLNNLASLLESTFPVLRKLHTAVQWRALVRGFMQQHRASTPLFLQVPKEFLDYLTNEREPRPGDLPFLLELAHYEWAELALSVAPDIDPALRISETDDLLDAIPIVSPHAWLPQYGFPVHRVSPDFRPTEPGAQPTFLVIYRRASDELGFLEVNAVTARMFQLLDTDGEPTTGRGVLTRIAEELQHPEPDTVVSGGLETLRNLRELEIVLGARKN